MEIGREKSIELTIKVNKKAVTTKALITIILMGIFSSFFIFNAGLFLMAIGVDIVFNFAIVSSFTSWLGYNFIGLGVYWIYDVLFKKELRPIISKDVQAKIKDGLSTVLEEELRNK